MKYPAFLATTKSEMPISNLLCAAIRRDFRRQLSVQACPTYPTPHILIPFNHKFSRSWDCFSHLLLLLNYPVTVCNSHGVFHHSRKLGIQTQNIFQFQRPRALFIIHILQAACLLPNLLLFCMNAAPKKSTGYCCRQTVEYPVMEGIG